MTPATGYLSHRLLRHTLCLTTALLGTAYSTTQAQSSSSLELDELIVTGIATTQKDSLQAVDILLPEELQARFDGSLGATLADLPGLSTTNFGPAVGRPIIRGFGGDRVRILTNGIDLIDASTVSTDHALSSEGLEAERVEVLRGSAAIPYGGNAVAGVVNVIDGSIPTKPIEDGVVDGRLYVGATSVDDGKQVAGRVSTSAGNFTFQVEGLYRDANDVEVPGFAKSDDLRAQEFAEDPVGFEEGPEDVVTNTAFDFQMIGGGVGYHGEWGHIGIAVRDFEANYGLPLEDEDNVGIDMEQTRIDSTGEFNLDVLGLNIGPFDKAVYSAGVVDYEHGEFANGELATLFSNEGVEFRGALLNGEAGDRWNGSVGAQFVYQDFSAVGDEDFIPPAETTDIGVFGAQRLDLGGYGFEGGLRFETREVEPEFGETLDFDTLSGSAGVFWRASEAIFTGVSLARTERAPTNAELFSTGFHPATGTVERGNVELEEETALSIEGVFNMEGEGWFIEAAAYATDFEDFIFLSGTNAAGLEVDVIIDDVTGETAPEFNYLQDDATYTGFEFYGEADIAEFGDATFKADVTAEYVRGKTDDLGDVPFIPPASVILGASLVSDYWQFRADVEIVDEADNQADFELPTDNYTLLGVQAQFKPLRRDGLKVIIGLENLTDKEARLNTSQLKDFVPLPGRNVRISLAYDF